jgi:hypothetical protein
MIDFKIGLGGDECAIAIDISDDIYPDMFVFGTSLARQFCLMYDFDKNTISGYNKN